MATITEKGNNFRRIAGKVNRSRKRRAPVNRRPGVTRQLRLSNVSVNT